MELTIWKSSPEHRYVPLRSLRYFPPYYAGNDIKDGAKSAEQALMNESCYIVYDPVPSVFSETLRQFQLQK